MGLLETIRSSIASRAGEISTSYIVLLSVGTFIAASILLNVFSQIFLKDKTAPPVVFHWVPFIGSTISYGMDPYSFFFESKEKVSYYNNRFFMGRTKLTCSSMATSSPSSYSARRPLSFLAQKVTTSSSTASTQTSTQRRSTDLSQHLSSARMLSTTAPTRSSWNRRRSEYSIPTLTRL